LHTGFAPNANGRIELDDAVIALVHGSDRADAHTWRVGAVIAARHLKAAAHIGIRACFDILDPRSIYANWHLILGLARSTACMTSDAFALVDQKSVICH
jgi:hypothetical protein